MRREASLQRTLIARLLLQRKSDANSRKQVPLFLPFGAADHRDGPNCRQCHGRVNRPT